MKYRLMDLLACPMDKTFPLGLTVLEEERGAEVTAEKVPCELYCSWKSTPLTDPGPDWVSNCRACLGINIRTAVLTCPSCRRWYPVLGTIPRMLPDELRSSKDDKEFLNTYGDRLPKEVADKGVIGRA